VNKEENTLLEEISKQKKQIELLQFQCRKAGKALVDQEIKIATLVKDLDRVSEERDNLKIMMSR
jgi:beta-lactamase class A|tara:strand:+ start:230 stop:421 length:192 start_codon:yes stop_codon:yes gene_type:complete